MVFVLEPQHPQKFKNLSLFWNFEIVRSMKMVYSYRSGKLAFVWPLVFYLSFLYIFFSSSFIKLNEGLFGYDLPNSIHFA